MVPSTSPAAPTTTTESITKLPLSSVTTASVGSSSGPSSSGSSASMGTSGQTTKSTAKPPTTTSEGERIPISANTSSTSGSTSDSKTSSQATTSTTPEPRVPVSSTGTTSSARSTSTASPETTTTTPTTTGATTKTTSDAVSSTDDSTTITSSGSSLTRSTTSTSAAISAGASDSSSSESTSSGSTAATTGTPHTTGTPSTSAAASSVTSSGSTSSGSPPSDTTSTGTSTSQGATSASSTGTTSETSTSSTSHSTTEWTTHESDATTLTISQSGTTSTATCDATKMMVPGMVCSAQYPGTWVFADTDPAPTLDPYPCATACPQKFTLFNDTTAQGFWELFFINPRGNKLFNTQIMLDFFNIATWRTNYNYAVQWMTNFDPTSAFTKQYRALSTNQSATAICIRPTYCAAFNCSAAEFAYYLNDTVVEQPAEEMLRLINTVTPGSNPVGSYSEYVASCDECNPIGTEFCKYNDSALLYQCQCKAGYDGFICSFIPMTCANFTVTPLCYVGECTDTAYGPESHPAGFIRVRAWFKAHHPFHVEKVLRVYRNCPFVAAAPMAFFVYYMALSYATQYDDMLASIISFAASMVYSAITGGQAVFTRSPTRAKFRPEQAVKAAKKAAKERADSEQAELEAIEAYNDDLKARFPDIPAELLRNAPQPGPKERVGRAWPWSPKDDHVREVVNFDSVDVKEMEDRLDLRVTAVHREELVRDNGQFGGRRFDRPEEILLDEQIDKFWGGVEEYEEERQQQWLPVYDDDAAFTRWLGTEHEEAARFVYKPKEACPDPELPNRSINPRNRPVDIYWLNDARPGFIGPKRQQMVELGPWDGFVRKALHTQNAVDLEWEPVWAQHVFERDREANGPHPYDSFVLGQDWFWNEPQCMQTGNMYMGI
ncbi:unnamed protein product, partial [Mesorhabditis spiculigera]